jgi:hypothetical protein
MLNGRSLLFHRAAATGPIGLPDYSAVAAGQYTYQGLKAIPLDQSFHDGLKTCGAEL